MAHRITAATIVLLALLAGCSSSSNSGGTAAMSPSSTAAVTRATAPAEGTPVHWHLGTKPGVPEKHCGGAPEQCVLLGTEDGMTTGDLTGTEFTGNSAVFAKSSQFVVGRTDVFRGTVKGCGSGTLVFVGTELADLHRGSGEWRIVDGFGTGDLAHASGHGTGTGTVDQHGYNSDWEGVIDCGK